MSTTNQTLAELRKAIVAAMQNPSDELRKAGFDQPGSATSGINYYDLEPAAKILYPVITPLRNRIPRVSGKGGIQANWRAITAVNTTNIRAGVSHGNRNAAITTQTKDFVAIYAGIGLEDFVTFEADMASQGFDDVKALSVEGLLRALMLLEEPMILGGRSTVGLGTTPTPTLSTTTTGGTLAAQTLSVICVALSHDGFLNGSVTGGIQASISRTNADSSVDTFGGGAAQKSASATQVTTGATSTVSASVAAVNGAAGYAWFWGTAGNEVLGAITSINSVLIKANAAGTQTAASLPASDQSANALAFDGLWTQICASGSNAYIATQATGTAGTGTPLTGDGAGGVVEIDVALKAFWDNFRLSPTDIFVHSQEQQNITAKILAGNTNAAQRFVFQESRDAVGGGVVVRSYLNKFALGGAKEIPVSLHPNMVPGTIMFYSDQLPYPLSNVRNVVQIRARRDYYQIEWPLRSRKYEYGVYADEVLQNYFPPAFGIITNIGNG
jgi:hypothetical protein